MKKLKVMLAIIVGLWMPVATLPLITGCSLFKGAEISAGSDPIIVHAQRTREYALATFDTFLKWERDNRMLLNSPEMKGAADNIRANYGKWDQDLALAIGSYQAIRSQENANKLDVALVVVHAALETAQRYLVIRSAQSITK